MKLHISFNKTQKWHDFIYVSLYFNNKTQKDYTLNGHN